MTLISVLIVLALEFYFKWGSQYRTFGWFTLFQDKLEDKLGDNPFYDGWAGIGLTLLAPVVILWLFTISFSGSLYWLVLSLISVVVLFISLGPQSLAASFAPYFESMQREDKEAGYLTIQQQSHLEDIPEGDDLVRNATRVLLVESQTRYFGVIFWFIFLGPFGALFYRLCYLYYVRCQQNSRDEHLCMMAIVLHWLDWLPARITSLLFLLSGDFVRGFYLVKDYLVDFSASNQQVISETGVAALGFDIGMGDGDVQENYDAIAMIQRTLIIYLVVVAALSPLAFW